MGINFHNHFSGILRITRNASPQKDSAPTGKTAPAVAPSAVLLALQTLESPRRPENSPRPLSGTASTEALALFTEAAKQVRRCGFVGPRGPAPLRLNVLSHQPLSRNLPATQEVRSQDMALLMLQGAINGTKRLRSLKEAERDHILKMLLANDLPGLAAVALNGNPLRSYATGLKAGKQLLERDRSEPFPPVLDEALRKLKDFYETNPALVALGDARAYSPDKPRTKQDVDQLSAAFAQGDALLADLERALDAAR